MMFPKFPQASGFLAGFSMVKANYNAEAALRLLGQPSFQASLLGTTEARCAWVKGFREGVESAQA